MEFVECFILFVIYVIKGVICLYPINQIQWNVWYVSGLLFVIYITKRVICFYSINLMHWNVWYLSCLLFVFYVIKGVICCDKLKFNLNYIK